MRSEISEQRSQESESFSEPVGQGGRSMSSVAIAREHSRELGRLLAGEQGWKAQVSAIHRAITDPKFEFRLTELTWNRVKSWLFAEARRVDYEEIRALEELRALKEAQLERLNLAATANRLAALLAAEGAPLDGRQMRALGRLAGALDSARIEAGNSPR